MPEGDVVLRTAQRLDRALSGAPLTRADLRFPEVSHLDLTGYNVIGSVSYGKHILTRLAHPHGEAQVTLHSHLRMEGTWYIHETENHNDTSQKGTSSRRGRADNRSKVTFRTRAILANTRWTALGQQLGMLNVVPTAHEDSLIGHLGPDILSASWDQNIALKNLIAQPKRTVGEALLDQRNLAGIGTYFMSESLFLKGISPWATVAEIADIDGLLELNRVLLQQNATRAIQATTGSTRSGETSYVHARSGLPCRRCGNAIRVAMIGPPTQERTAFYCPHCQPGPTPTDDGRYQKPLGASSRSPQRKNRYSKRP